MRSYFKGTARNEAGDILASATISVYLAGTATPASIYTTLSGAVAVNSVTSAADGTFSFYVSFFDYDRNQKFKIIASKTGEIPTTWDNLHMDSIVIGTYNIADDTIVTTNLGYIPEGVLYEVATGKTLTMSGSFDAGMYQIFSCVGTGAVTLSGKIKEVYPEWFGLDESTAGATNITYLNSTTTATAAGAKIKFCSGKSYPCEGTWTISKAVTVDGYGTELTWNDVADNATNQGILVTASNANVFGLKITGVQAVSYVREQVGIHIKGTDNHATGAAPTYISNNKVRDCEVTAWSGGGIIIENAENFEVADNYIHDGAICGVATLSAKNGTVSHNIVDTIGLGGLTYCYGFQASYRAFTGYNITSAPACSDIIFSDNLAMNIPDWEAYDTHGGVRISFVNNHAYDTYMGLVMGSHDNVDGDWYVMQYCKVSGNTFYTTLGNTSYGISEGGKLGITVNSESSIIEGNEVIGYTRGIRFRSSNNVKIVNNSVSSTLESIVGNSDYDSAIISGNHVVSSTGIGILFQSPPVILSNNSAQVFGNTIVAKTYGITTNVTSVYQDINIHDNIVYGETANYRYLNYTNWQLYTNTTQVSTSGPGEDTLMFMGTRLPAKLILNVKAAGVKTDSGSTDKTIRFYYGASTVTFHPAATDTDDWQFEATIIQTAAAAQKIFWKGISGTSIVAQGYEDWTEDTSAGTMFIYFTGQSASSAGVIKQEMMILERKYE